MFKSILIIIIGVSFVLCGIPQGWSSMDMEDRFIDPDFNTSKTIFIDVKNVSLMNVLKIISKQTGLSFIASQDVADKKITLYLNKVPISEALDTILDANGLMYDMQDNSNIFVVKTQNKTEKTKITKVFQLKYATVSSSKLNTTISTSGGSGGASSGDTGGLEEAIKDALSKDGKVIEDSRTNSLIITDVPGQFSIIESTIAKLDVPIPQILIEVEMLDVSKSTADQIGIQYGSGGTSFTPVVFTGGAKSVNYPFSVSPGSSSSSGSGSTTTTSSSSSSSGSSGSSGPYTPGSFSATGMLATLQFLTTNTDARTLARPRILTLNNQTAQIEISTDQAISIETTTTGGTSGITASGVTPERYTTGVVLKVTPQANLLTREITMAVSPKVVDVILSQVGSNIYDPETRGSDSVLKLKDGQSMVIGGLLRNEEDKTVSKLPFLGDLPLIGAAFRYTNSTKDERELVIFLTPHIIDDTNQLALNDTNASISPQAALDIQDAENRAQEVNNSLNNFDSK